MSWIEAAFDWGMAVALLVIAHSTWTGSINRRISECICRSFLWVGTFSSGTVVVLTCAALGLGFGGLSHVSDAGIVMHAFLGPVLFVGTLIGCYLLWTALHD